MGFGNGISLAQNRGIMFAEVKNGSVFLQYIKNNWLAVSRKMSYLCSR